MKEYVILTDFKSLIDCHQRTRINRFSTLDEAIEFAKTLKFGVTIYESVAESSIDHNIEIYDDNGSASDI